MDPLANAPVPPSGPSGDADREARIEQLLLSGLDHYFAGQYERAISVWTRVVFIERNHDRARAYIERARSAVAERQRESEELQAAGIAAYDAGEVDEARSLLTQAAEQGSDTAQLFLDRLSRVTAASPAPDASVEIRTRTSRSASPRAKEAGRRSGWMTAGALALVVAVAMLLGGLPIGNWLSELTAGSGEVANQAPVPDPLPIVRGTEIVLERARALHEGGRSREALMLLERIDIGDPLRGESDRLRAQVQADLLARAGLTAAMPVEAGGRR